MTVCGALLAVNGHLIRGDTPDATYDVFYRLAAGELSEADLAEWLRVKMEAAT